MTETHFINIGKIIQANKTPLAPLREEALGVIRDIDDAFLIVQNGRIESFGKMQEYRAPEDNSLVHDVGGKWILPSWVDSHTHTLFAKSRSEEFRMRMAGRTYQEIAAAGGGILNSAAMLRKMSEEELTQGALERMDKIIRKGTGALEIKSGYGLSVEAEMKMLRIINNLKDLCPIPIKATFLGAHAFPQEYKNDRQAYVDLVCTEMLPAVAADGLADYCDAFCETGYFTPEECRQIAETANSLDLTLKLHTNQFTSIGGIQMAIDVNAKSVDHLEIMTDEDIDALSQSRTIACILPIAPFFLKDPYPPARQMVDAGCIVAIATDFNPGSAPSYDMALAIHLACNHCGLTPEEAFNAATINGAHAMDLADQCGMIAPGFFANFSIHNPMSSLAEIPYKICSDLPEQIIINGEFYNGII